ncbi:response regulator transcription factor [Kocuria sp. UBA5001]|uniref:response regulator transcription factor n=1 Tax=Kocuria sp. UBA5001 TaxID=1946674 RepID=UPI0025B948E1|nr:response regulator [Kocuria sp. UBA5001]
MSPEHPSVLVADDDPDIRDLVVFKLQQAGYEVRAVEDGTAALGALEDAIPDLVVLDVMMPGLSGLDVLRQIRTMDRLDGVKVLLLTARARDTDVDDGYNTGADDYVTKPFSPRELLHRVNSMLGRGR